MSFGRGSSEHWKRLGLPVVTEAVLRDFIGDCCASSGPTGYVLDHDGPAGKWPVLHNRTGWTDGGPPLGLVAVGPRTMALAGELCDFVIMHTFFSRAGDAQLDRGGTPGRRARRARPRRRPHLVLPGRRTRRPVGGGPAAPRRRASGHLLPGLRRHAGLRQRLGPGASGSGSRPPSCSSRPSPRAARSTRPRSTPRRCSGSPRWSPTSGSTASAHGRPEDAARTIVRELELGCHSVILHGAEPHEIAPMVDGLPRRSGRRSPGRSPPTRVCSPEPGAGGVETRQMVVRKPLGQPIRGSRRRRARPDSRQGPVA